MEELSAASRRMRKLAIDVVTLAVREAVRYARLCSYTVHDEFNVL